jgi:tetratricopeptide (TPR) repeat protein
LVKWIDDKQVYPIITLKPMRKKYLFSFIVFIAFLLNAFPAFAEKRIAVLPFEVLTQENNTEQFGVGTMDTLINSLNGIPGLVMIDRGQLNAVMKEIAFQQTGFTDHQTSVKLGKLLNAQILILGTIQSFSGKYKISVHYTNVETGEIIKTLQVTGDDIFELQEQLAEKVLEHNDILVSPQQQEQIKSFTKATGNLQAYDYYNRGRTAYLKFNNKGYEEAVSWYSKALETDDKYYMALAGRAEALALWAYSLNQDKPDYKDLLQLSYAEIDARKALEKNPNLPEVHRALAVIYNIQEKFNDSEKEANEAIRLNPNDAEAYIWLWAGKGSDLNSPLVQKALKINPYLSLTHTALGNLYREKGMYEEAINELKKTIQLDPESIAGYSGIGQALYSQYKFSEAIPYIEKTISLAPDFPYPYCILGYSYIEVGRIDDAITVLKKFISLKPNEPAGYEILGTAYMKKGYSAEAENNYKKACNLGLKESCQQID